MAKVQIHRQNLYDNMDIFVQKLGSIDKLCVGLKDNAYGHGIQTIAKLCKSYGIKQVFVRNIQEAKIVSSIGFQSIHILNEIPKIKTSYDITINSLDDIKHIVKNSKVQLKLDTGMHRNGIITSEIPEAIDLIISNNLKLSGVFSHLCCADENNDKTKTQEKIYQNAIKQISCGEFFEKHIANSSGVFKVNNNLYDKARVGIGIYGYIDIPEIQKNLKPVLSLLSSKNSTRVINKGETVGYGSSSFVSCEDNFVVSNYDIGYGDGFFRINENQTYKTPSGKQILGRVSMDNFSVQGDSDEVVLFDDVRKLAKLHNTITYEILTNISHKLPRTII